MPRRKKRSRVEDKSIEATSTRVCPICGQNIETGDFIIAQATDIGFEFVHAKCFFGMEVRGLLPKLKNRLEKIERGEFEVVKGGRRFRLVPSLGVRELILPSGKKLYHILMEEVEESK